MTEIRTIEKNEKGDKKKIPSPPEGNGIDAALPAEPDSHMLRMQAAFAAYAEVVRERDELIKRCDQQTQEITRFEIQLEQAKEAERIHLKKVIDDAIMEGKKAEIEVNSLREEIVRAAARETEALAARAQAEARSMRLIARLDLIKAALSQALDEDKAE